MSSIITRAGVVLTGALILLSIGCSKERTPGVLINPDTGKHTAQWGAPDVHGAAAKGAASSTTGFAVCQECHTTDFSGGISKIACLNTAGCHGMGVNAPHAAAWLPGNTYTHITADQGNAPVCALCHLGGRTPPSYATVPAGVQPGCFNNTLCHAVPGHANPAVWALPTGHGASAKAALNVSAISGFSTCQICHSTDFTGGIALQSCMNTAVCHGVGVFSPHASAPWLIGTPSSLGALSHVSTDPSNGTICALCHLGNRTPPSYVIVPAGTQTGCFNNTLCHAIPTCLTNCHTGPPSGTTAPNQAGKHTAHDALPNVMGVCDTCHSGTGINTIDSSKHNNGTVDVVFLSACNAESGPAGYNAAGATCSNISCHGGQITPGWLSGTVIDVNTQCTACHVQGSKPATIVTPQYNSYFSGRHSTHISGGGIACYTCHDTTLLAVNHFTNLNTTAMEGPASATIAASLNYNGVTCSPVCHQTRTW